MSNATINVMVVVSAVAIWLLLSFGQMAWSDFWCGPDKELVRLLPRKTCVPR